MEVLTGSHSGQRHDAQSKSGQPPVWLFLCLSGKTAVRVLSGIRQAYPAAWVRLFGRTDDTVAGFGVWNTRREGTEQWSRLRAKTSERAHDAKEMEFVKSSICNAPRMARPFSLLKWTWLLWGARGLPAGCRRAPSTFEICVCVVLAVAFLPTIPRVVGGSALGPERSRSGPFLFDFDPNLQMVVELRTHLRVPSEFREPRSFTARTTLWLLGTRSPGWSSLTSLCLATTGCSSSTLLGGAASLLPPLG